MNRPIYPWTCGRTAYSKLELPAGSTPHNREQLGCYNPQGAKGRKGSTSWETPVVSQHLGPGSTLQTPGQSHTHAGRRSACRFTWEPCVFPGMWRVAGLSNDENKSSALPILSVKQYFDILDAMLAGYGFDKNAHAIYTTSSTPGVKHDQPPRHLLSEQKPSLLRSPIRRRRRFLLLLQLLIRLHPEIPLEHGARQLDDLRRAAVRDAAQTAHGAQDIGRDGVALLVDGVLADPEAQALEQHHAPGLPPGVRAAVELADALDPALDAKHGLACARRAHGRAVVDGRQPADDPLRSTPWARRCSVSLGLDSGDEMPSEKMGGSVFTTLKYEKGARLNVSSPSSSSSSTPSAPDPPDRVDTKPMGRGVMAEIRSL
ncbi:hypothetical protein CHU98_g2690 [Xylaria longipes]|nr:hypothetical protein CHU98_g2690 [Xylaria longipes]